MKKARFKLVSVVEEIIFGVEDSFVSTLGTVTGIAVGTQSSYVVLLSGVVLIFSEAVSMAAGSYLSSKYEREVWLRDHAGDWDQLMRGGKERLIREALRSEGVSSDSSEVVLDAVESQRKRWLRQVIAHEKKASLVGGGMPVVAAGVMGVSYLVSGIVPLGAYLFLPVQDAILPSIVVTAVALFGFGAWGGVRFVGRKWYLAGFEMMSIALTAAFIGYVLGLLVRWLFGVVV